MSAMKDYECIVLTYNVPHRKTFDTLCLLKANGYKNVLAWAVDFHYKKTFCPIYEHRPPVVVDIFPCDLCANLGYDFIYAKNRYDDFDYDVNIPVLICGAGILPEEMVKRYKIINAHPGYIPMARGLDAFKWSIVDEIPIGVTTHLLGDEIDAGEIIDRRIVDIFENDTFHSVAQRVYENEIVCLVDALGKLDDEHQIIHGGDYPIRKRMQRDIESSLMDAFEKYKHSRV